MTDPATITMMVDTGKTWPVPRSLITDILPAMTDLNELHVVLAMLRLVLEAGDVSAPFEESTFVRDRTLRDALRVVGSGNSADYRIATGLDLAVGRGVLLRFRTIEDQHERVWYTIATPEAKSAIDRMLQGESLPPRSLWEGDSAPRIEPERPTVFRLYEQNIGLLTPLIADQLRDMEKSYPPDWIDEAFMIAVAGNKRALRYIQAVLKRWETDGKDERTHEAGRGDSEAELRRKYIPDEFSDIILG